MAFVTYPLNKPIKYDASAAQLFMATRSSGIHDDRDFVASVTGADNDITLSPGLVWYHLDRFSGLVAAEKGNTVLDMSTPDTAYPRVDAVVLMLDMSAGGETKIVLKKGIANSAPKPPVVTRTATIIELHLYHVKRTPGKAVVELSDIADVRADPKYCGYMIDSTTAIDTTMSKAGYAADAGAVGAQLAQISRQISAKADIASAARFSTDKLSLLAGWKPQSGVTPSVSRCGDIVTLDAEIEISSQSYATPFILEPKYRPVGDVSVVSIGTKIGWIRNWSGEMMIYSHSPITTATIHLCYVAKDKQEG